MDGALLDRIAGVLGIGRAGIVDAAWANNGPGWVAVLLASAGDVLALRPGPVGFDPGVVGPYPPGSPCAFEVRAFAGPAEDPVTGSLNAAIAPYVASQGTVLGRAEPGARVPGRRRHHLGGRRHRHLRVWPGGLVAVVRSGGDGEAGDSRHAGQHDCGVKELSAC